MLFTIFSSLFFYMDIIFRFRNNFEIVADS